MLYVSTTRQISDMNCRHTSLKTHHSSLQACRVVSQPPLQVRCHHLGLHVAALLETQVFSVSDTKQPHHTFHLVAVLELSITVCDLPRSNHQC